MRSGRAHAGGVRNRTATALCAAGALLAPTGRAAPGGGDPAAAGSVAGEITVVTRATRRLASAGAYPGRTVVIPPTPPGAEVENVVVFLEDPPAGPAPSPGRAEIRQVGEHFVPHLVAVTVGSTVHFPNDDRIFHNVFSLTPGAVFDLGRYPRGDSASHVFTAPGVVKVFCHLHSHMSAIVRVFDHPYFAVPGKDGRYRLEGLPPGPRSIAAWHERAGVVRREVTVVDGQVAALSFALPLVDTR